MDTSNKFFKYLLGWLITRWLLIISNEELWAYILPKYHQDKYLMDMVNIICINFTVQSFLLWYYNIIYNINREYTSELDKY